MSEVLLIVLQHAHTAVDVLHAAERMAELAHSAHISVLAVGLASAALKTAYEEWLTAPRAAMLCPRWHEVSDDVTSAVEDRGARADLIVIARPSEDDERSARHVFQAAVLRTGRPVLVVPPGGATGDFGRRVAVAWRQDARTAKAVLPALRYIASADRVFLLVGLRTGAPAPGIPEVMAEHGVRVERHLISIGAGAFGEALLAKVQELGADLLVMGAYANSALHNLFYGGVTQFMLGHADFPVLMRY